MKKSNRMKFQYESFITVEMILWSRFAELDLAITFGLK
jgi:hypothetical protein